MLLFVSLHRSPLCQGDFWCSTDHKTRLEGASSLWTSRWTLKLSKRATLFARKSQTISMTVIYHIFFGATKGPPNPVSWRCPPNPVSKRCQRSFYKLGKRASHSKSKKKTIKCQAFCNTSTIIRLQFPILSRRSVQKCGAQALRARVYTRAELRAATLIEVR